MIFFDRLIVQLDRSVRVLTGTVRAARRSAHARQSCRRNLRAGIVSGAILRNALGLSKTPARTRGARRGRSSQLDVNAAGSARRAPKLGEPLVVRRRFYNWMARGQSGRSRQFRVYGGNRAASDPTP